VRALPGAGTTATATPTPTATPKSTFRHATPRIDRRWGGMKTDNPTFRRFTLSLFALLALGAVACGAAPEDSTGTGEPAVDTPAPSTPGATAGSDERDGGAAPLRPIGHAWSELGEPASWSNPAPGSHPAGGYLWDQAPRSR